LDDDNCLCVLESVNGHNWDELEPFDVRISLQIRLDGLVDRILVVHLYIKTQKEVYIDRKTIFLKRFGSVS
jgi:hypothetical protein